jgi:thymidylate kinase
MKIAMIGTHGTGKTTAVHEVIAVLKKKSIDAGYLEEVARRSPLPINEETTKESQSWIFYEHVAREIEMEHKSQIVVCDRSILDIYAYYFRKFGKNNAMEETIKERMPTYSQLFYFPLDRFKNRLQNDGVRAIGKKFQEEIDGVVKDLLAQFEVKYETYHNPKKTLNNVLSLMR